MELKWNDAFFSLPDEFCQVLVKVMADECEDTVILTVISGQWVTDATMSEIHGSRPHSPLHCDYTPTAWAYLD